MLRCVLCSQTEADGFHYFDLNSDDPGRVGTATVVRDSAAAAMVKLMFADMPGVDEEQAFLARCMAKQQVDFILGENSGQVSLQGAFGCDLLQPRHLHARPPWRRSLQCMHAVTAVHCVRSLECMRELCRESGRRRMAALLQRAATLSFLDQYSQPSCGWVVTLTPRRRSGTPPATPTNPDTVQGWRCGPELLAQRLCVPG